MPVLYLDTLERAEAVALTAIWEGGRAQRLAWLETQVGRTTAGPESGLDAAWCWYMTWKDHPTGAADEPTPIWWVEGDGPSTRFTRDHAVALDAIGHLWDQALSLRFPELVRTPTPGRPWTNEPPEVRELGLSLIRAGRDVYRTSMIYYLHTLGDRAAGHHPRGPATPDLLVSDFRHEIKYIENLLALPEPEPVTLHDMLAAGDLFEIVRDPDDADYPWQIHLDEEVANDHEGLVTAFASALADAPGVSAADHTDREVISLAGSKIRKRTLTTWATTWWKDNLPPE
jgi:hypothetical protein